MRPLCWSCYAAVLIFGVLYTVHSLLAQNRVTSGFYRSCELFSRIVYRAPGLGKLLRCWHWSVLPHLSG